MPTKVQQEGTRNSLIKGAVHNRYVSRSNKGRRATAALALAVSLWLAGAGAAYADEPQNINTSGDWTVAAAADAVNHKVKSDEVINFNADNITLTVPAGFNTANINLNGHSGCKIIMEKNGTNIGQVAGINSLVEVSAEVTGEGVTLQGGKVTGDVNYSGVKDNPAHHNSVTVDGTEITGALMGKEGIAVLLPTTYNENINIHHNTVVLKNGKAGSVIGGRAEYGIANNNSITISNSVVEGTVWEKILGGTGGMGANNNTITISNGSVIKGSGNIVGGVVQYTKYAGEATGIGNRVIIENSTVEESDISGAFVYFDHNDSNTGHGDVLDNIVIIKDSNIGTVAEYPIYGAYVQDGNAGAEGRGNKVIITGGNVKAGEICGGMANSSNEANYNEVFIETATVDGEVYGGHGGAGASHNTVTIEDGYYTESVVGGSAGGGECSYNTLNINGGNFNSTLNGIAASGAVSSSVSDGVEHNVVNITAGQFNAAVCGGYVMELGSIDVFENELNISGGTFADTVYGGINAGVGSANGNTLKITGGTFEGLVIGGASENDSGDADNNAVTIEGGNFSAPEIIGGLGAESSASGNTVTIKDGTFGEGTGIFGGQFEYGITNNNTVNIFKSGLKVAKICVGDGEVEALGNKLVLGAAGVEVTGDVTANTIKMDSSLEFEDGKTVLKGNKFNKLENLDISGATKLSEATSGSMTLLESGQDNEFAALKVDYSGGSVTFGDTTSKVIKEFAKTEAINGVTVDYNSIYSIALANVNSLSKNAVAYSATCNASKLTFGNVEWKDSGALLNHKTTLSNISFDGAAVDTSKIAFTNKDYLATNSKMTLVSDFGTKAGDISGTAFTVGKGTGEGNAYYENGDLRYVVTKGVVEPEPDPQPQNDNAINQGGDPVSGNVDGDVIGGEAKNNGVAEQNTKEVLPNSQVNGNVTAATSENGAATKNEAKSTDADISGSVTGAQSQSGAVAKNKATVTGGSVGGNVVAASTDSGVATGNLTTVNNVNIGGDVVGAQSNSGTVSNGNKAEVTGGSVGGSVYGGKSDSGEVSANSVQISGGTVQQNVYGGQTDGGKAVYSNQVAISDATVTGTVYGGYSDKGTAESNQVQISGEARLGDVYGGKSAMASNNNVINFSGGTAHNLIGGGCDTAAGNTVNMDGGTVENIYGAQTGTSATNNQIYLGGGTVNQNVYGGYSDSGTTSGNSVTLYGAANVSAANLYGGNLEATGNVLNIGRIVEDNKVAWTGGGQSVNNISNFETMNFVSVPWNKEKAAVTISDGTASDLSGTKVNATTVHFTDTTSLKQGDTMTLLDEQKVAADKRVQTGNITKESEYTAGSTLKGTGILSMDDSGNVIYKVTDKDFSDQSHNTVMGATASMAALSAGNDFVGSAVEGLGNSNNTGSDGLATYANLGGGSMNVETGSHVKTHTWNAILAIGHKNEKKLSTTEYGAFFEYGTGNYSTFNGDERGDGSTRYTGGGILGKWQKNNGFYVEGSLRAGSIHDDANNVLRDVNGNPYSYTTDATYWGAHIGVGKELKVNKTDILDLYAKYFYNHRGSVSFDAGGHYDLDAVDSSVLRIGTRYTVKKNENFKFYGGIALEHEFAGRASGFAAGVAIRGADISGTSVRGEIGATFRPGEKSNVTLDLNLSGFAGKKQGFTGGLSAVFHI